MVDEKKSKRGRKKGTTVKGKKTDDVMMSPQKLYDKLMEEKKEIDKKLKVHIKYCKNMGFKLSKRVMKIKEEIEGKIKGKPGRKKKVVETPEVKSVQ